MKKIFKDNSKRLMISHIGDIDGLGSPIIASLVFNDLDIILTNPGLKDEREFIEYIDNNIDKYEEIFICDLGLEKEIADRLNEYEFEVHHFDHHISNIYSTKYKYSTVLVEFNSRKTCGTELFYNYMKERFPKLDNIALHKFVELIRAYDTWDWFNDKIQESDDLTTLFQFLKPERFFEKYVNYFNNHNEFIINSDDHELIDIYNENKKESLEKSEKSFLIRKIDNYNVGITVSENYNSIIGNTICRNHPEIDYIMLVDLRERSCSMRTIKEIDLSVIASSHGGGGHKQAAGFPLNSLDYNNTLELLKDVI